MSALLRQSLTQLLRRPGSTLLLVLLLALGIGVNAGMFAVAQQALLRPLPMAQPARLVRLFTFDREQAAIGNASFPLLDSIAREVAAFESVASYIDWGGVNLSVDAGAPERALGAFASGRFFETLGLVAARGRLIGIADDRDIGQSPVVVLTDRYWRQRFDADAEIVGRQVRINRQSYQVIGVLQPGFESPDLSTTVDMWLPLAMAPQALAGSVSPDYRTQAQMSWLDGVARLPARTSVANAQAALDVWSDLQEQQRAPGAPVEGRGAHMRLIDLRAAAIDPYGTEQHQRNAWLLLGVSLLVLAIAAANAAGLIAVRSEERVRDFAVRASLGADRRQLLALLLTETMVVVALALLLGWALSWVLVQTLVWLAPPGLALPAEAWPTVSSLPALASALACAIVLLAIAAIVPLRQIRRMNVIDALRSGGRSATAGSTRQRARAALVVGQLALTLVLLTAAVSLVQTLQRAARVELGFDAERVLAASLPLARPGVDRAGEQALLAGILDRARVLPGVEHAGWINAAPVQSGGMRTNAESDVERTPKDADSQIDVSVVSAGALEALGIPLLRGRGILDSDDGTTPVVVVNRAYADRFLPGVDPLTRRVLSLAPEQGGARVVGVVANSKRRSLREDDIPQIYVPMSQFHLSTMTLLLRSPLNPQSLAPAMQQMITAIDPELPVFRVRTLSEQLALSEGSTRVFAGLLGGFAALSALLAAAGIYGLLSYWLRLRERELGIRIAIGAGRTAIAGLILRQGGALVLLGLLAGTPLVLAAARLVDGLLFGISAADPGIVAIAAALLLTMVVLACALPLHRALATNPVQALRAE